jgi:hypothetical protein
MQISTNKIHFDIYINKLIKAQHFSFTRHILIKNKEQRKQRNSQKINEQHKNT